MLKPSKQSWGETLRLYLRDQIHSFLEGWMLDKPDYLKSVVLNVMFGERLGNEDLGKLVEDHVVELKRRAVVGSPPALRVLDRVQSFVAGISADRDFLGQPQGHPIPPGCNGVCPQSLAASMCF